jgi:hypothetical protein
LFEDLIKLSENIERLKQLYRSSREKFVTNNARKKKFATNNTNDKKIVISDKRNRKRKTTNILNLRK